VNPILKSEKLTSLLENRGKLKVRAEQSKAEVWRLTRLLNPQFNDVTVLRVADVKDEAKRKSGVATSGTDEQNEAARREDALKRTLAGQPLSDSTGNKEKLDKEHRQWAAIESAIEFVERAIALEKGVLAIEYSKQLRPKHEELMRRVCKTMYELHTAWNELYGFKRHLIDSEIGLRGLCLTMPDFLSAPNNKYSEMADFFRAAQREGYVSSIPKEFK